MSMQPVLPLPVILRPYGLVPVPGESWQALPSASGNSVWAVDTGTGKIVVRCNHPARTWEWLELEAGVLEYLAQAGFPAVRQRRTFAGQLFVEQGGRFWAVFEYIDAVVVARPDDKQLAALGRLQARLHQVMAAFPGADRWAEFARRPRSRKSWAYIVPLADTLTFLDGIDIERRASEVLPQGLAAEAGAALAECRGRLQEISRQLPDLPGMLTHYDYGQYNVLFAADGTATVIDFDILCWESVAANVARALSVVARDGWMGPFEPPRAVGYLAAYQEERAMETEPRQGH